MKVLIVDGYSNHDWQRTTRLARGILEPTGLFDVTVSTAPANTNDPAYATWSPKFKDFDAVIQTCNDLGGRGPLWPAPVRDAFERFVREGLCPGDYERRWGTVIPVSPVDHQRVLVVQGAWIGVTAGERCHAAFVNCLHGI